MAFQLYSTVALVQTDILSANYPMGLTKFVVLPAVITFEKKGPKGI